MKYKAIGITALAVILVLGSINWQYVFGIDTQKRYHQHWDAPQKTPCKTAHAGGELCTHLPIISINTGGKTSPGATLKDENGRETGYTTAPDGSDRITAYISTFDNESEFNHPTDASDFSSKVEIHIRGNSSRSFDKPGYAIKLITEGKIIIDKTIIAEKRFAPSGREKAVLTAGTITIIPISP